MTSSEEGCTQGIKTAFANSVRGLALIVFGTQARDQMLIAEMSVTTSIRDLLHAENNTKRELALIVDKVKVLQSTKTKGGMTELLLKSRMLRNTLGTMNKKRLSMEKQLETLRQSQLNQNMLLSMKHTSEALQKMGMKISDADNVMLDLEESTSDFTAFQTTLSTSFVDDNMSDSELNAELDLILSDNCLEPKLHRVPDTLSSIKEVNRKDVQEVEEVEKIKDVEVEKIKDVEVEKIKDVQEVKQITLKEVQENTFSDPVNAEDAVNAEDSEPSQNNQQLQVLRT
jgi:hypothetical protein